MNDPVSDPVGDAHDESTLAEGGAERGGRFDARRDGLGLALFTSGAFCCVLLVLALSTDEPLAQARGTGVIARAFAGSIGLVPGLVFCAGIALLGARNYLAGPGRDSRRHAGGLALTAIGLSVLLGAFSTSAGGLVGDLTAGTVARFTHPMLGVCVGLAVFLVPVWMIWLRPNLVPLTREAAIDAHAARREAQKALSDEGVSLAEAEALIPEYRPLAPADTRKQQPERSPALAAPIPATPTSPPERSRPESVRPVPVRPVPARPGSDVRRRGEVPDGARPLETTHAHVTPVPLPTLAAQHDAIPAVRERPAVREPAHPELAPREDLAVAEGPEPILELPASIAERPRQNEALDELRAALAELLADRSDRLEATPEPAVEDAQEEVPEYASATETELAAEGAEEDFIAEDPAVIADLAESESFEPESIESGPLSAGPIEPELAEPELAAHADVEKAPLPRALPRPSWEQPELFAVAEEPVDAYGTPISTVEAIVSGVESVETADDERVELPVEVASHEPASEAEPRPERQVELQPVAKPVVVPAPRTAPKPAPQSAPKSAAKPAPKSAPKPAASIAAKRERVPAAAPVRAPLDERNELLAEIGCLLVDRGRVAVSMLQKQYGMDFEEATRVLDELQSLGLIGPYLGGKHRDILLTRDEWLEKVSSI